MNSEPSKITNDQLRTLLSGIASFVVNAKVILPENKVSICRDAEDNMILECCAACDADFFITGDKDLLEIEKKELRKEMHRLKIVSPRTFLKIMNDL